MRALLLCFLALSAACVERSIWIRTEPEGARVRVNGDEIGHSPVNWGFDHYGEIRVETQKPGYEPQQTLVDLKAPWYEYPVIDFFSDIVWPGKIRDEHAVSIRLSKSPQSMTEEERKAIGKRLAESAKRMREETRKP